MWNNQIFSLIKPVENIYGIKNIIQNIIVCDNYEEASQIAKLNYGIDAFAVDTTTISVGIGCEYINGNFYTSDEKRILPNPTEVQRVTELENKTNIIEKVINPTIDYNNCTLDELKLWQINQTKLNLATYLENNPIQSSCHGGVSKYYSITKDKTSLLTQMVMITQLAIQSGVPYTPSWNATGEKCTYDWTLQELQQLAFEIELVVRPLVSKQQELETYINNSISKEEVLAINIEF